MAPNKFEKQLKDTLERRTIAPSKNAWSQLDTQLDDKQTKQKFTFWWIGVAATVAGVFFAVTIFKNKPNQDINIVDGVKNEVILPKINTIKQEVIVNNNTDTLQNKKDKLNTKKVISKKDNFGITASKQVVLNKEKTVTINKVANTAVKATKTETTKQDLIIDQTPTSLNEADLLLKEAFSEVQNKNTYKPEKIDANSLLEGVEMQSEKSLKNRLFHAVKSGYETLKTTVVDRDN